MMSESMERTLDKVIQYGAAFSEVSPPCGNQHDNNTLDPFQLNDIAKTAFTIAEVTFEVRARYWCITSEIEVTLDHLALEGTK